MIWLKRLLSLVAYEGYVVTKLKTKPNVKEKTYQTCLFVSPTNTFLHTQSKMTCTWPIMQNEVIMS